MLAIAGLSVPYWIAVAPEPRALLAQALVFVAAALFFGLLYQAGFWMKRRVLGGGDLKLYMALALWLPPLLYMDMLIWMAIGGFALSLVVFLLHRRSEVSGPARVPYGVAIAGGTFAVFGELIVKQFPA